MPPNGFRFLAVQRPIVDRFFEVNGIDRKIIATLECEGRLSLTELAARVGLSVSACHRRLRALEDSRTILGYRAVVDPAALDLAFEVLVFVTLRHADSDALLTFEGAVAEVPHVLHAQRLFGEPDYLLRVRTANLDAYAALEDDVLASLPGVDRLRSTLVMKTIVDSRPLPG